MQTFDRRQAYIALRVGGLSDSQAEEYLAWHMLHVRVWKAFERVALELLEKGQRVSGKKIAELARERLAGCGCDYAVNNNRVSAMARLFCAKHPEHASKFEFRRLNCGAAENEGREAA